MIMKNANNIKSSVGTTSFFGYGNLSFAKERLARGLL